MSANEKRPGPRYVPTLIIHGGAGDIRRENLPAELYAQYKRSLTSYLESTAALLHSGSSALDAACHAVSQLEDDPLFNCGRGAVFTTEGTIELEASVMVASVYSNGTPPAHGVQGVIKRTGAVSQIRNTRHPILLARQVLLQADEDHGLGKPSSMHGHVNGRNVEEWGWNEKGLERKPDDWFWTKQRWDEHRRGLGETAADHALPLPSQGTVGCVCFDMYGNIACATSTGGLTNKAPGRVGDTPTVGAGFWAESWTQEQEQQESAGSIYASSGTPSRPPFTTWSDLAQTLLPDAFISCLPLYSNTSISPAPRRPSHINHYQTAPLLSPYTRPSHPRRRLIAMSGTGNGDSFLRIAAAHSAAALCRYRAVSLQRAVTAIVGPGGELQRSAGERWMKTGEGQGGMIAIEYSDGGVGEDEIARTAVEGQARVVFDFNCGGMWRAYYTVNPDTGKSVPKVRVFRDGEE